MKFITSGLGPKDLLHGFPSSLKLSLALIHALILFGVFYLLFSVILGIAQQLVGYDALALSELPGAAVNCDNYLESNLSDPLQVFFTSMKKTC